jgi:hypothetical protein
MRLDKPRRRWFVLRRILCYFIDVSQKRVERQRHRLLENERSVGSNECLWRWFSFAKSEDVQYDSRHNEKREVRDDNGNVVIVVIVDRWRFRRQSTRDVSIRHPSQAARISTTAQSFS